MTDRYDPQDPEDPMPDDPVEDGVADDEAVPQDDEHVVPMGAEEDVRLADSWVKDGDPIQEEQSEQREADGFR